LSSQGFAAEYQGSSAPFVDGCLLWLCSGIWAASSEERKDKKGAHGKLTPGGVTIGTPSAEVKAGIWSIVAFIARFSLI